MTPSLLSGAIVCPIRFAYVALVAAMVATASPFTANTSEFGNEPFAARYFDEVLLGRNATGTAHLIAAEADSGTPAGAVNGRQPDAAPAPVPTPATPRSDGRSLRGSALNTITVLH